MQQVADDVGQLATCSGVPSAAHLPHWRSVTASIQRVITRTKPVCSAYGMNSLGATMPRVGWLQRTSASAPITVRFARSIFGW